MSVRANWFMLPDGPTPIDPFAGVKSEDPLSDPLTQLLVLIDEEAALMAAGVCCERKNEMWGKNGCCMKCPLNPPETLVALCAVGTDQERIVLNDRVDAP